MILVTATCEPPSCAAMLPQKFSAATTVSTEEPADVEGAAAVLVPFPQPARRGARLTESPIPRAVQGVDRMLDLTTGIIMGMILIATCCRQLPTICEPAEKRVGRVCSVLLRTR